MFFSRSKTTMVRAENALPGRDTPVEIAPTHLALRTPTQGPWPDDAEVAYFGMGCFWGSERLYWEADGVVSTTVGYQGGHTPNPTYEEVCSGRTGHTEAVRVVYDPSRVDYEQLLKIFWENHDPTTPNRQGNDVGTQYRSAIYWTTEVQRAAAEASRERYQAALTGKGFGEIVTEIEPAPAFFVAEDGHQQYLFKNPRGYCNHGFCQVGYDLEAHGQTAAQAVLPDA